MDDINHIGSADHIHPELCSGCGDYLMSSGHCIECERVITYDDCIAIMDEIIVATLLKESNDAS